MPNNMGLFSLPKIINGASRTLNVISKIIPIYEKIKPTIKGSKTIINYLKDNINLKSINNTSQKKILNKNNPTFFK